MKGLSYLVLKQLAASEFIAGQLVVNELGYPVSCRYTERIVLPPDRAALLGQNRMRYVRDELALPALLAKSQFRWHLVGRHGMIDECPHPLIEVQRLTEFPQQPERAREGAGNELTLDLASGNAYLLRAGRKLPPEDALRKMLEPFDRHFNLTEPLERLEQFLELRAGA
jgi:hypothetical protein